MIFIENKPNFGPSSISLSLHKLKPNYYFFFEIEGSSEVIETLINAGADANSADNSKRLPLHWTCANGFLEASRYSTKMLEGLGTI